jgi:2-oxoglutarate ferredoxin oxidoreductase subunit beta
MHSGAVMRFRSIPKDYDPADRLAVVHHLRERRQAGEVVMGLLYAEEGVPDVHELNRTSHVPLVQLPFDKLCPGSAALHELQAAFR